MPMREWELPVPMQQGRRPMGENHPRENPGDAFYVTNRDANHFRSSAGSSELDAEP